MATRRLPYAASAPATSRTVPVKLFDTDARRLKFLHGLFSKRELSKLKSAILRAFGRASQAAPWNDEKSIREELFSIERLEQHARSLAAAQPIVARPMMAGRSLAARLRDNESVLLGAYRAIANAVGAGRAITPAAEWLLDNYHLVEEQIREIRDDLPPGYYRQLPKLASGPFARYPRVFGVAWAFVAHTDS
jgi:cyclic beta-1,2-glucan synthetase